MFSFLCQQITMHKKTENKIRNFLLKKSHEKFVCRLDFEIISK